MIAAFATCATPALRWSLTWTVDGYKCKMRIPSPVKGIVLDLSFHIIQIYYIFAITGFKTF